MTDTAAREEAVERVRAYVESWEGFEPSVTISDERDPNSLYLGDLRLLLSGGEGGSVAIASREGRAVIANLATEELLALVLDGDHRRGCQGREYTCSCGYDTRVEREATTLRSALTDPRQPSEAEPTEHKGRARTKGPKLMNRDREAMAAETGDLSVFMRLGMPDNRPAFYDLDPDVVVLCDRSWQGGLRVTAGDVRGLQAYLASTGVAPYTGPVAEMMQALPTDGSQQ